MAVLFCVSHLSEVVGVRLADGREVVVKRRVDESGRAGRCVTAQRLLAEQGFPCPMPLTDVIVSDGVAVHAERFVGGGELETKDTPEAAARSGRLLADLVRRLATFDLDPPLPNPEWVRWDAMPERRAAAAVPAWIEDATRRERWRKDRKCRREAWSRVVSLAGLDEPGGLIGALAEGVDELFERVWPWTPVMRVPAQDELLTRHVRGDVVGACGRHRLRQSVRDHRSAARHDREHRQCQPMQEVAGGLGQADRQRIAARA